MTEFQPSRREVLQTAATLGIAAMLLVDGCSSGSVLSQPPATAYLRTDLPAQAYDRIGNRLDASLKRIGHIPLAFADFDQFTANIRTPSLHPELRQLIGSTSLKTDLAISIGGSAIQNEPWKSGIENPKRFSLSAEAVRKHIEDVLQRPTHMDIDCEEIVPAIQLARLVHTVRDTLPADRQLTLAVPAAGEVVQNFNPRLLRDAPQLYRVMAYDWYGPWSTKTGPVASGPWDRAAIAQWVHMVGNERRVSVGYPAYGYVYGHTSGPGDAFDPNQVRTIPYADIPRGTAIHDDTTNQTSEAIISGNWASFLSPNVIGRIVTDLANDYPHLNGSFFWDMDGLTPAHLDAVGARVA